MQVFNRCVLTQSTNLLTVDAAGFFNETRNALLNHISSDACKLSMGRKDKNEVGALRFKQVTVVCVCGDTELNTHFVQNGGIGI